MNRLVGFFLAMLVATLAFAQTHQAVGVVKKVDKAKGSIEIKHQAVKSLNWPGMTMSFKVRDKKLLEKLTPEQKIRFELVEDKGRYVIVDVK